MAFVLSEALQPSGYAGVVQRAAVAAETCRPVDGAVWCYELLIQAAGPAR